MGYLKKIIARIKQNEPFNINRNINSRHWPSGFKKISALSDERGI